MSNYQSAFTTPFRIIDKKGGNSDKSPTHSVVFNYTREAAVAHAQWLMAMADRIDIDGTTISVWDAESRTANDVPGFAMWGSLWDKAGKLSPPAIKELPF